MLSIQHILHSLYTYDMTYLHRYGAYFLNLVRLCAYTKKEIKKVILSTKSYTEKDLVDLPTIIDQWKNEYRSDRSLAWPTL